MSADVCGAQGCKKKADDNHSVWYSSDACETTLCDSCYRKWHRFYGNPFKRLEPNTARWAKACEKAQKEFDKWFDTVFGGEEKNKGDDER